MYNDNGGSGNTDKTYVEGEEGSSVTLTVANNNFTAPSGKYFERWKKVGSSPAIYYNAGDEIVLPIGTEITLEAQWQETPPAIGRATISYIVMMLKQEL